MIAGCSGSCTSCVLLPASLDTGYRIGLGLLIYELLAMDAVDTISHKVRYDDSHDTYFSSVRLRVSARQSLMINRADSRAPRFGRPPRSACIDSLYRVHLPRPRPSFHLACSNAPFDSPLEDSYARFAQAATNVAVDFGRSPLSFGSRVRLTGRRL